MNIKPVEFLYDTDDLICWDEDTGNSIYYTQIDMSLALIYDFDNKGAEVLVGNAYGYLNDLDFTLTDHNMVGSVVLELGYTYDYDNEDSDRVLWEYLELFYFILFNKTYFYRDSLLEEVLTNLNLKKKK